MAFLGLLGPLARGGAAPGELDASFGNGGVVTTSLGTGDDYATGMALQNDGKIVVAGTAGADFAVVRYNSDGTPDTDFGAMGQVITDFGASGSAGAMALQSDGKIVLAGRIDYGDHLAWGVARYNLDGSLDTSFGSFHTGKVVTSVAGSAAGVAVQSDGRIVVVGYGGSALTVVRYNADGTLDTDFNGTGLAQIQYGSSSLAHGLVLQSDGKIVVNGYGFSGAQVRVLRARFNPDGTLDGSFANGLLDDDGGEGYGVVIQRDGKIVLAGDHFFVGRLNPSGNYDPSFAGGSGGKNTTIGLGRDVAYSLALQGDGRIVLAGYSYDANTNFNDFAVVRYNADGNLDTSFHSTGKVTTIIGAGDANGRSVAIQNDGKIVVAGYSFNGARHVFTVVRYHAFGNLAVTAPANGSFTNNSTPEIGGTANSNAMVNVYLDGAYVGTVVASASGAWSFTPPHALSEGSHAAKAVDAADSSGTYSNTNNFTVDTVAPASPLVQTPADGALTNNTRPFIGGTAEASSTVTVFLDGIAAGTATASQVGVWSFSPAVALADGQHTVKAIAADRAGNTGAFSSSNSFVSSNTVAGTPGDLDTSFGSGGVVTTVVGSGNAFATSMVLQSDGKIIMAGTAGPDFAMVRYNAAGTLDPTFGTMGQVLTDFGASDGASGMALQGDGKIVLAGRVDYGDHVAWGVARYNTDGSLDPSFGSFHTGKVVTNVAGSAAAAAVQADGKIVVVGYAGNALTVVRYNADGTLDNGFNGTGLAQIQYGSSSQAHSVVLQNDGKIIVNGYGFSGPDVWLLRARFNVDGTLDGGFANGLLDDSEGYGVVLQSDGRIVVAGDHFFVARLDAAGRNDPNFAGGNGGRRTTIGLGRDLASSVALQSDGKIVLAGFSYDANTNFNDFAIVRYNADGSLDTGFHITGKLTTIIGTRDAYGRSVVIQNDGRILVAGYSFNGTKNVFTLARYYGTEQPPIVHTTAATVAKTTATLTGTVNPNSLATTAHFEYGLDTNYGNLTDGQACGSGVTAISLNAGIGLLTPNTTYHYRLVATNSAALFGGVTYGNDVALTTDPDPPLAFTGDAESLSTSEATLVGVVIPNGRDTDAHFEYGLSTAYGSTTPVQSVSAANDLLNVFAPLTGLIANKTYHFRLVAKNSGSPNATNGDDKTFVAKPPVPAVVTGKAFSLSHTSVRVSGTVLANDASAQVFIDYGTDPNFSTFGSVSASPSTVIKGELIAVSQDLTDLAQGLTYYYRVRAVNAGGAGTDAGGSFAVDVLSGLTQVAPGAPPAAQGFLLVNLSPAVVPATSLKPAWRFVGEQAWRAPGVPAGGLTTGDRAIEFRPVQGYHAPLRESVTIVSGAAATVLNREYFEGSSTGQGALSILLKPEALADVNVPQAQRAQWRLLGQGDPNDPNDLTTSSTWQDSGTTLSDLPPGFYLIESKPVAGRATPAALEVKVLPPDGHGSVQTSTGVVTYFLADAGTGTPPTVVPFEAVTGSPASPYQYTGQIRSDSGFSSGFVVKSRVVATAGHVVFDDAALTAAPLGTPTATGDDLAPFAATGLQWYFQRDRGTYEPPAQLPRGFYVLTGYAAQRVVDRTAGQSTPASQTLDVAALYFLEEAGRGGAGGYLASDAATNEFLVSPALKTLVGYPVDGVAAENQGRMHATPLTNVTFAQAFGRTYTTSAITSYGGNSGGPLCVQFEGGAYYPAAIYLGGSAQTVVRAIDGQVVDLFNRAEVSGNGGANNTGGGITQANSPIIGPGLKAASLKVIIAPAAARAAGAQWRLKPGSYRDSGAVINGLVAGSYTLQFSTVPGFQAPNQPGVTLQEGFQAGVTFTYAEALPPVITGPKLLRAIRGQALSFNIQSMNSPTHFSVGGLTGTGLTLVDAGAGTLSGTPMTDGTYELTVTASNAVGPSTAFKFDFVVSEPRQLTVLADPTRGSVSASPKRPNNVYPQGDLVTLTAKAKAPGFIFAGWAVDGATADSLTKTTTKFEIGATSVAATASFIPNPFLGLHGNFAGRVAPAAGVTFGNTGRLTMQMSKLGAFSGSLLLGAKSFKLKGQFAADGSTQVKIKRTGSSDLVLDLMLDLAPGGTERVTGTLTADGTALALTLEHAVFNAKTNAAPLAGAYTMALLHPAAVAGKLLPEGDGYAAVTVRKSGAIRVAGRLGDGGALTQGGVVSKAGAWPLHAMLSKSGGVLTGDLAFNAAGGPVVIGGGLNWIKPKAARETYPDGFTAQCTVTGLAFAKTAALAFSSAGVSFSGGGLAVPPAVTVDVDVHKNFTAPDGPLTFQFTSSTGLFTGKLSEPGDPVRKFQGALIGKNGYGWFVGASAPQRTGYIELHGN